MKRKVSIPSCKSIDIPIWIAKWGFYLAYYFLKIEEASSMFSNPEYKKVTRKLNYIKKI